MLSKWDRRVIPKWRTSKVTADLPECRPIGEQSTRALSLPPNVEVLEALLGEWRVKPSIGVAANIINFSHLPEAIPWIKEVAEDVLSQQGQIPPPLLEAAKRVVGLLVAEPQLPEGMDQVQQHYRRSAASLKQRLRTNLRNPIALVDLALVYAALGQDEKARDAVLQAVVLNPNHRFVLRSAARLLIHVNEAERALRILTNSARALEDPWLLAPLISTTAILGKPQKQFKRAKLLFGSLHPVHVSELGGALATIQIVDGDFKSAKRTFNAALIAPNDNTVAQAMWAAENFSISITPREEWFNNKFSCEGRYYQRYSDDDFEGAMKAAIHWFRDEPFSTRPMKAACFISGLLGRNEESEKFALEGLRLDKEDLELRNNLIFSLGSQNRIDEAVEKLLKVVEAERRSKGHLSAHSMANVGMLMYRSGSTHEAEIFYRRSIEEFGKSGDKFLQALASAFMAREALQANASNAAALVAEASEINNGPTFAAGRKVLDLLQNHKSPPTRNEQAVTYDQSRNILFVKKLEPYR